ncbi:putative chromosome-partitioning protein ParB [Symmachiella dynata]|uniref:ParB/RepB/Spo0J family partition protein n=1 Tax=Symmachiella dynata TaxID=2527995 RepID=UPI00118CF15E|nr:ParB/RepB/Spo0J family partition protein [Symmachiella dynata]QDT51399.1 putative chromosome-partitioning protein ParB [Symmachiella dynata]
MDDQQQDSKRRLGRGLSSLLGGSAVETHEPDPPEVPATIQAPGPSELVHVAVDEIERNPYQPRREFDLDAINELVDSVSQHGVLQPLLVRLTEQGYQLIAGERRLIASQNAGLTTVPCRVLEIDDQAVFEIAIVENDQRQDLNDIERAQAYQEYLDKFHCTVEELARKVGKGRSSISNCLRLLELPKFIKQTLAEKKISAGHARALLPLEDESQQIAMCQRIQSESMSVRQTEQAVRDANAEQDEATIPFEKPQPGKPAPQPNHHLSSLQQQLRDLVSAKVDIRVSGKDRGKIIIHFNTNDEFERIIDQLKKAA